MDIRKEMNLSLWHSMSMQHETRAMIDGQIHDIGRVGKVIQTVKRGIGETD